MLVTHGVAHLRHDLHEIHQFGQALSRCQRQLGLDLLNVDATPVLMDRRSRGYSPMIGL